MSAKPIFLATHPRACSTAFERVFMTRRDILKCVHEPFGDAYYYGPERLAERYEDDESAREKSGFQQSTYQTIFDRINKDNTEGKRLLIKDMAQYFIPPNHARPVMAPSLVNHTSTSSSSDSANPTAHANTIATTASDFPDPPALSSTSHEQQREQDNPTVVPAALLSQFHFAFLIRHPRNSIPSYYRCTIPPLAAKTGFHYFRPDEAGYVELRALFDYLRAQGLVGPRIAGRDAAKQGQAALDKHGAADIIVLDADDLLDAPAEVISTFCKSVGIDYSDDMLTWDEASQAHAADAFAKWDGFHEDAIRSQDLKPRQSKSHKAKSDEDHYTEWVDKYGKEGAEVIRKTVEENVEHYEYLKEFAIKPSAA